jgi:hypothetical protein
MYVCDGNIAAIGENIGLPNYTFFKNQNDHPGLSIEVAKW